MGAGARRRTSVPESIVASNQSAGDASWSSRRAVTATATTSMTANAYGDVRGIRLRQSSSGPVSSAMPMASVMSDNDEVARRQRSRVLARSATATLAVTRRSPDGATTSKAEGSAVVRTLSKFSASDTGATRLSYRKASASEAGVAGAMPSERSAALVPALVPSAAATGVTYTSRRPSAPRAKNQASPPCRRSAGSSDGRPPHASGRPSAVYTVTANSASGLWMSAVSAAANRRRAAMTSPCAAA